MRTARCSSATRNGWLPDRPVLVRTRRTDRGRRAPRQGARGAAWRRVDLGQDHRDGGVHLRRPGQPLVPGHHPSERGDVRPTRPSLRVPELRHPLLCQRGHRGGRRWSGGAAAGGRADRGTRPDAGSAWSAAAGGRAGQALSGAWHHPVRQRRRSVRFGDPSASSTMACRLRSIRSSDPESGSAERCRRHGGSCSGQHLGDAERSDPRRPTCWACGDGSIGPLRRAGRAFRLG